MIFPQKNLKLHGVYILRQIVNFPPGTRIIEIHKAFGILLLEKRTDDLLRKFTIAKRDHDLIAAELAEFEDGIFPVTRSLNTNYDKMLIILANTSTTRGNLDTLPPQ